MKKITLNVKGMHCSSCEVLLKDSLEESEGISNVEVSHKNGIVTLDYDESWTNREDIKKIISSEGYKVK